MEQSTDRFHFDESLGEFGTRIDVTSELAREESYQKIVSPKVLSDNLQAYNLVDIARLIPWSEMGLEGDVLTTLFSLKERKLFFLDGAAPLSFDSKAQYSGLGALNSASKVYAFDFYLKNAIEIDVQDLLKCTSTFQQPEAQFLANWHKCVGNFTYVGWTRGSLIDRLIGLVGPN
ncbi:MAG: hypothetical protein HRT45_12810 [Bdellovibrionales bacterium]|nr:hypothetical protein [Bdellovibrionales bacterium]